MALLDPDDFVTLRYRLNGEADSVEALLEQIRAMDDVDHVTEAGADAPHMPEDSSSAGLSDDLDDVDFHVVTITALNDGGAQHVRDRVEIAAREHDIVLEYLEDF